MQRPPSPPEPLLPAPAAPLSPPPLHPVDAIQAIPQELEELPFFQEHQDRYVSLAPLRDPVADKRWPQHIYERSEILRWLNEHSTSPANRAPMTAEDLVECPELKEKINQALLTWIKENNPSALEQYEKQLAEREQEIQRAKEESQAREQVQRMAYEQALASYEANAPLAARVQSVALRALSSLQIPYAAPSLRGGVSVISPDADDPVSQIARKAASAFFNERVR